MKNKTFYILSALLAAGFIGYIIYIRMKDKKKGEEANSGTFPVSSDDTNSGNTTPVNADRPAPGTDTTQTTAGTTGATDSTTTGAGTTTAAGTTTTGAGTTTATAGTAATYTPPTPTGTGSSVVRTWQMNPTRITVNTNRV